MEDILRGHPGDGQHGDCIGVYDGVSLLLLDLSVSFTDHQPVFRASSQPHGHSGKQAADHEGGLGRRGEAVPVKGTYYSMKMWGWGDVDSIGWGVDGYIALAGVFLTSVQLKPEPDLTRLPSFFYNNWAIRKSGL